MNPPQLVGGGFPDGAPGIRTITTKYSDPHVRLSWVKNPPDQHVELPPADARALAADLTARADLIDPGDDVEWCVFYGGPDPDNAAGVHRYPGAAGQAEAEEDAQWLIESGVARRAVTYGAWQVLQHPCDGRRDADADADAAGAVS